MAAMAGVAMGMTAATQCTTAQNIPDIQKPLMGEPAIDWHIPDSCRLSGSLSDSTTGDPLIGANIILRQNGEIVDGSRCDYDGKFSITVPTGNYEIEITYVGFIKKTFDILLDIAFNFILWYCLIWWAPRA